MIENFSAPIIHINFKRIFLLSDLHFGVRGNSLEWLNNQLTFFDEFYIPFLKQNVKDGDILVFIGDFFDNRQLLDINVMNKAIDTIIKLSHIINIHMIVGNHDLYKKNDTDVNSLSVFKFIPNVTIYENPAIISNGKSNILLMPWVGDPETEEKYAVTNVGNASYIFAHTDMYGFKYDNGKSIVKGVDLHSLGFKRIFSGHIHKRQDIGTTHYIGSPYHTKRSDIGNKKAVYIFDPDNNTLETFDNNVSPVFQRIQLNDILEWTLDFTSKVLDNNYTDIIVPDKYINLFNLTKFIDLLKGCSYKKIEVVGEKIKNDEDISSFMDGENIKDIITLLEDSINELNQPAEMLERLKTMNKEYYEKANKEEVFYEQQDILEDE